MATVTGGDYQFSARPQPILPRGAKYREEDEYHPVPTNIMFDRRVVRGNTYAAFVIPANTQLEMERQQASKRHAVPMQQAHEESEEIKDQQDIMPEVEVGQELEPLPDPTGPIQEAYEFFVDRPPIPLFIPNRAGEDKDTQIEDDELFDYEVEVEPVLQVLVGKAMEQARMEVIEEDEAEILKDHQAEFQVLRRAHLLDIQRVEAQDIRRAEESERRKLQAATRRQQMKLVHQKYCCRIISKRFLAQLKRTAYDSLEDLGVLADPRAVHLHDQLMEILYSTAHQELLRQGMYDQLLQQMVEIGQRQLLAAHKTAVTAEHDRKEQIRLEQIRIQLETEERKRKRAELRAIRKKEQELKALKDKVEELFINEGDMKEHCTQQTYADIDGRNREHIVGTPGGLFGEWVLFLAALENQLERELTEENIRELLLAFLQTGLKAPVFAFENIDDERLATLIEGFAVENLTIENLFDLSDEQKLALREFLRDQNNAFPRTGLTFIWSQAAELGLRGELIPLLIDAFADLMLSKPEDEALLAVLRNKLKLKGLGYGKSQAEATGREQAVLRIRIPLKKPALHDSELDEESHEPSHKDSMEVAPQEVDVVEDRVHLVSPCKDQMSVFVVHQAAQRFLRRELSDWVRTVHGYEQVDSAALQAVLKTLGETVESALLATVASELPVFDFELN